MASESPFLDRIRRHVRQIVIAGPGERTGFNLSWAAGSHGEVALYGGAAIVFIDGIAQIAGAALDYMVFEYDVLAPVAGPGTPIADQYRYNPPGAGGLWLSGPVIRLALIDDFFRISIAGVYVDTNTNANWNVAAGIGTPGVPNPAGAPGVPTPGADLAIFSPGPGALTMILTTGNLPLPFAEFFTFISTMPLGCANGPIAGLGFDVFPQVYFPLGTPVFHNILGPAGIYTFTLPGGASRRNRAPGAFDRAHRIHPDGHPDPREQPRVHDDDLSRSRRRLTRRSKTSGQLDIGPFSGFPPFTSYAVSVAFPPGTGPGTDVTPPVIAVIP